MSQDFYMLAKRVRIYKPDNNSTRIDRAVRLYCTQHQESWSLQVRGPLGIGSFGLLDGKSDIIADAALSRKELISLREAINIALLE
jgi:hypothetical protein